MVAPAEEITVTIDRLVLDGWTGSRRRLAAALERELTRMIAEGGVPDFWADGRLGAAVLRLDATTASASPERMGAALARAMFEPQGGRDG